MCGARDAAPVAAGPPLSATAVPTDPDRVQVLELASPRDGVHLARLRVETASGETVGLSLTLDRDRLDVRLAPVSGIDEPWLHERSDRIREAVEGSGLSLGSLEIDAGTGGDPACEDGDGGTGDRRPTPNREPRTRAGGWTL